MANRSVAVGGSEYELACDCGWTGGETDVESWDVQRERDRVVRVCPGCGKPVPEWGAFGPIDGVVPVARGPLRDSLRDAGVDV